MSNKQIANFPITVYGQMEQFNDTISKGRCRVFYKGANRNGTFITEEFAEKLIASAPYAPIKGIYIDENEDYSGHGLDRAEGRIYGVVPADPHFAWEAHLDDDGIERQYACFDVLYYTALYKEAEKIKGKGQSMELYHETLKGNWEVREGKKVFVFTDGCFLGLQALGDEVEPCFEGAGFYSLDTEKSIVSLLEKYEKRIDLFDYEQGGDRGMFTEEIQEVEVQEAVEEAVEETAVEDSGSVDETVTATEEADAAIEDAVIEESPVEITENYVAQIEQLSKNLEEIEAENSRLSSVVEEFTKSLEEANEKISNFSSTIEELNTEIDTLKMEKEEYAAEYEKVLGERDELLTYKREVETSKKLEVISSYEGNLAEEIIEAYSEKLDSFTAETLDKELAYELKKSNPNLFSQNTAPRIMIPKEESGRGIENILERYEKH